MRYKRYMYPQCRTPYHSVEFLRAKVFARLHATRVGTESIVVALRVRTLIAGLTARFDHARNYAKLEDGPDPTRSRAFIYVDAVARVVRRVR